MSLPSLGILSNWFLDAAGTLSDPAPPLMIEGFEEALAREYPTDAFFCTYQPEPLQQYPRCKKAILSELREAGVDLVQTCFALDWDTPGHVAWASSPVSVADFLDRLQGLADGTPWVWDWAALYTTAKGARIIYVLDQPLPVDEAEMACRWVVEQFHAGGLFADRGCVDWTHVFRLPRVQRDGKPTSQDPSFLFLEQYDRRLPIRLLGRTGKSAPAPRKLDLTRPVEDDAKLLLEAIHPDTGRMRATDWYVKAKKLLSGRACYPCLFEYAQLAEVGERDQTLIRYIGQAIAILKPAIESTTPQHVYGLFVDVCRTLGNDQDWLTIAWDKICRIWESEVARDEAEAAEKQQVEQATLTRFERIHQGMMQWCDAPELRSPDPQEVREFIERRLMVSIGDNYVLMGEDGYYEPLQLRGSQVIARMRINGLDQIVATKSADENGVFKDRQLPQIINAHATVVDRARGIPSITPGATVEHLDQSDATLVIPCYCRNPLLEPEYDEDVDEWLYVLFGKDYAAGCDWIRWAMAWDEGPICALSIKGAAGVGKKLLTQGLAETLRRPALAGAADLVSEHQYGLLESPFLVVNEGWPQNRQGMHPADQFRALVGGDPIRCARKYFAPVELRSPVRIVFTANNIDVIRMLTGNRDLSPEDREALAVRLLHFDVGDNAAKWFRQKGGLEFTAGKGRRWIAGDGGQPSNYVIAKHFMWLWAQRPATPPGKRFLVEGGNSDEVIFEMRTQSGSAPLVIEALIEMLNSKTATGAMAGGAGISIGIGECPWMEKGRLFVLTAAVLDHYRKNMYERVHQRLTAEQVTSVFRGLLVAGCRQGSYKLDSRPALGMKRWYELDPRLLLEVARKDGWKCDVLEMLALDEEKARMIRASEGNKEETLLDKIAAVGTVMETRGT